jgi:hypothetical protein
MSYSAFARWVQWAEERFPVADWRVDGVHVWPLVRLNLYHANFNPPSGVARGVLSRIAGRAVGEAHAWARAVLADYRMNSRLDRSADAVFLAYSIGAQPILNGRCFNPLLAPYVDAFEQAGVRTSVWEMSPSGEYNVPRSVPSNFIQMRLHALRAASALSRRTHADELPDYDDFLRAVKDGSLRFHYSDLGRLRTHAWMIRVVANHMRDALARAGARCGIVADYGMFEQAFCLACAELGLPRVEVQHGVQGPLHAAYAPWRTVPAGGYPTRPSQFWCWSEANARGLNEWAPDASACAVTTGDPWFGFCNERGHEGSQAFAERLAEQRGASPNALHVLTCLTCVGSLIPDELISAMQLTRGRVTWWLRLHPVGRAERRHELARHAEELGVHMADVDIATSAPLPLLLQQLDALVAVGPSSVVGQATALGMRAVVCGPSTEATAGFFPSAAAAGLLTSAANARDIVNELESVLAVPRGAQYSGVTSAALAQRVGELLAPWPGPCVDGRAGSVPA